MRVLLFLVVLVVAPVYGVYSGALIVPNHWNPWAPLEPEEPLNWLTRYKLGRLTREPAMCLAFLDRAKIDHARVADRVTAPGCGFANAVRVTRTTASVGDAFTLSCRSAAALVLWEQHVLQPAAQLRFGESVARLQHFGTYACRPIYGREGAAPSRHSTADAIDIAGFVLERGRRIGVAGNWASGDADALFLRDVRDGACRVFDGVLGPDYNAAHRDHFHFEKGGWRVCR
jgi:hypothetical protein